MPLGSLGRAAFVSALAWLGPGCRESGPWAPSGAERARVAIGEAEALLVRRREALASLESLRDRIAAAREKYESEHLPAGDRRALREWEREAVGLDRRSEEAYLDALDALRRAERAAPDDPEVRRAFARLYLARWREAIESGDEARRALFEERVRALDLEGIHRSELEGWGTIAIEGAPEGAAVHLFHYEEEAAIKPGGDFRLVPVPFHPDRGLVRSFAAGAVHPGDPALVVEFVAPGSPADRARIRPGDLVFRIEGHPIEGSVLVGRIDPEGPAGAGGVKPFDRLARLGGREIREPYDAARSLESAAEARGAVEAVFVHGDLEVSVAASAIRGTQEDLGCGLATPEDALEDRGPEEVRVTLLADGSLRELSLDREEGSGLRLRPTASPLVFSGANLLGRTPLPSFAAPPGSYLMVLRREGYEDLRLPLRLDRGGRASSRGEMLREGTTPEDFVLVPTGPFLAGGDPEALRGWPRSDRETPGFWIARCETTVGEYLEFLNDPETLREIEAEVARSGEAIRAPRDVSTPAGYWPRGEGGRYSADWDSRAPVLAVSWEDARAYARWRTARAAARGEGWTFELPREEEWEKAARGADGRRFPWGDLFDWGFCKGALSRPERARLEPVGTFLRDESPYGVLDLAGGVSEWCVEWLTEGVTRVLRGGALEFSSPAFFRAAYRSGSYPAILLTQPGIRLVARRSPPGENR